MPSTRGIKPNFFVVGAGRCGTTSLCAYIAAHPEAFICEPKEPAFFSKDSWYRRGFENYEKLFAQGAYAKARGEGTVNYAKGHLYPQVARRIADYSPDAKIIYITRNPLEQIVSNWQYRWLVRAEEAPFAVAVRSNPSYLATSDYLRQIAYYQAHFDKKQILVLFLEEMRRNRKEVLGEVFDFLQLETSIFPNLGPPLNVTAEQRREPVLVSKLRHSRAIAPMRRLVTPQSRRWLSRMIGRPGARLKSSEVWDLTTLDWALDQIIPRAHAFLEAFGRHRDYWSFEEYRRKIHQRAEAGQRPRDPEPRLQARR